MDGWVPDREFFYRLRANRSNDRFARAAEFIYLNKTCWNGLYRVNSGGMFNVPYGAPKSDMIVDGANVKACSRLLACTEIKLEAVDFRAVINRAGPGDLVFLDPPYVTAHNNNGFIDYNETLFSWQDQVAAAQAARDAVDRGASVIVTNAHHKDVIDLYDGFSIRALGRSSTIAASSARRTKTQEAVFWRVP
jgi:DNA adenine methylase